MAIYRVKIRGEKNPRYVKAAGRREASDHFLQLESLNADEVEELVGGSIVVERAGDPIKEPTPEQEAAELGDKIEPDADKEKGE